MTDTDVSTVAAPAPERKQEPETLEIPEPRITNAVEGKKKQKEAAKKLSDYSREVASRKVEPVVDEAPPPQVQPDADAPDPDIAPSDTSESSMSVGNMIALAGVGVAALCLYLSYRSDGVSSDEPKAASSSTQEEAPKIAPKTAKAPPRNTAEPRFRRL